MPPESPEILLQDTKKVRVTLGAQRNMKIAMGALLIVAIVTGLYRVWAIRKQSVGKQSSKEVQALETTPIPKTNTFVDSLYGTVLFLQDGRIQSVTLPDLKISSVLGIRGEETVVSLTSIAPSWSLDGKYLAVADQPDHITVSEYDTGKYVGTFPLKQTASESLHISTSFDPFSEVLAIRTQSGTDVRSESITFYAMTTQKELGTYLGCSGNGVWLKNYGYATRCAIADVHSVVLIQFEPSSSIMIPLSKETTMLSYTLIDEYAQGKVIALRTQNSKKDLVILGVDGVVTALAKEKYPKTIAITDLADPYTALQKRIEKETKLSGVKHVSVSSDDEWLAFESEGNVYVARMDLKEKPYLLGKGTTPLVRPY